MGILSFFDRFKASSSDRSAWGDFFFEPVSVRSVSGMRVSADSAMRLAAVYACVRILSETMASLPLVVYRPRKDGGKDRFDEVVSEFLNKIGDQAIVSITPIQCSYLDIGTQKLLPDFGVLVIYRG